MNFNDALLIVGQLAWGLAAVLIGLTWRGIARHVHVAAALGPAGPRRSSAKIPKKLLLLIACALFTNIVLLDDDDQGGNTRPNVQVGDFLKLTEGVSGYVDGFSAAYLWEEGTDNWYTSEVLQAAFDTYQIEMIKPGDVNIAFTLANQTDSILAVSYTHLTLPTKRIV